MLDIAFKEWAAVCAAIAGGAQSIIFRKGGIAEDGGAFQPEHTRFWLYPTYFHEDRAASLKANAMIWHEQAMRERPQPGKIILRTFVDVLDVQYIDKLATALSFNEQHIWTPAVIEQRFHYRTPGLYLLKLQATNREPLEIEEHPEYAGCKTWVKLRAG